MRTCAASFPEHLRSSVRHFARETVLVSPKVDVWPEVKMTGEYTGFDLEIEEPVKDEPRCVRHTCSRVVRRFGEGGKG